MIEFVERDQLDVERWDALVRASPAFRHYYLSYYLDHATEKWAAIVGGSYDWVWPLPYKSALVKWVFQPLHCQQLGPIGRRLQNEEWKSAERFISKHFSWFNIKFNDIYTELPFPNQEKHRNITLDLSSTYDEIASSYNRNVRSNLKKFERAEGRLDRSVDYDDWAVQQFRRTKGAGIPELDDTFYQQVAAIYGAFQSKGEACTYKAYLGDELLAQLILLEANDRSLVLFTYASEAARAVGAMHALIDLSIRERSGRNGHVLDFEGSDNDNLAYFYQSFGGREHVYLQAGTKSILHSIKDRLKP